MLLVNMGKEEKPTDFGVQLMAKQNSKAYYGNIGEKQFRKYFAEAERRRVLQVRI